ncbi:Sir2 family NAD+-dependent deacetylase [Psychromonas sp.]|uniref:Sir2 family NAD+-dependent deacetylase n=1 Tax=Psychromonas sp. TaxID=1884585 RepID=UPI0039E54726
MLLNTYKKIVVLTGAGISAESGIKTFRSADGLWENYPVEDVATPEGYKRNPNLVLDFYNQRRRDLCQQQIKPNAAHYALAKLEAQFNGEFLLITQNIDNLHEKAGSKNVIHMHGELLKARCPKSDNVIPWQGDLISGDMCSCCQPAAQLRPHIVWFGEMPLCMDPIYERLVDADLFIAIGTSGTVYPAAGFVQEANRFGADSIEINLDASNIQSHFTYVEHGKATELVPRLVEKLLVED